MTYRRSVKLHVVRPLDIRLLCAKELVGRYRYGITDSSHIMMVYFIDMHAGKPEKTEYLDKLCSHQLEFH